MQIQNLLTFKQQRVLSTLRDYMYTQNQSPTLEQLRSALGFNSLRTVTQYLDILERKGYIVRRKNASRNIELRNVDGAWGTVSIPVIANVGCDDLSVFAQNTQGADEFLEVDKRIVDEEDGDIVAVRAIGDSMNDAGINTGDYVLIRFTDDVQNGDRVAAIVNDMVTVKRLEKRDGMVILWPESKDPKFKPIILKEDFKIAGKVLCIIPAPQMQMTEVVPLDEELM
ncbi:repressor LexA [Candidatus Adlerbacteria bacterium RIFOXYC1_FULL_48_26]|uniref:Repressor LexA n=1 Tax=Candidatus Adlerbacteria bacterium RIFOXYC1_FULL_48_26 TaxID=1797247 RepID=A0A1F4Y501_9BACT|nr:MAG: repressor LexA [Candidatus Adlerbacteria bacterium RIFOXYC1_FULL_48_26]OGC94467.1 MAG: repressor LexA [Candidatus Adlerbacteria bacterium RIFOXYB1_FULL_48_10]OGC96583.1 MAG: repressor LexA [Candidatus Adlerbacteria bacterium RIFOXYD1_FULL_48_8]